MGYGWHEVCSTAGSTSPTVSITSAPAVKNFFHVSGFITQHARETQVSLIPPCWIVMSCKHQSLCKDETHRLDEGCGFPLVALLPAQRMGARPACTELHAGYV